MKMLCKVIVAAASMLVAGGVAMAQSAVGNAGFETDFVYDVPPEAGNWTAFFGGPPSAVLAAIRNTDAPRTGTSAMLIQVSVEGNSFAGVQQPISGLQPGVTYRLSMWARRLGTINNGAEYRIEWRTATGAIIGDQFALNQAIGTLLTDTYQQFTLQAVAPAGTAGASLVFAGQSFLFNPLSPVFDTKFYVDDVTFAAVSLPSQTACCAGSGACVVALAGSCPSGSTALAAGTTCSPNACPQPTIGACCNSRTGACVVADQTTVCAPLGGTFRGVGTTCAPNLCTVTPVCRADFNNSGAVSVQDIFDFLAAWFAGCP